MTAAATGTSTATAATTTTRRTVRAASPPLARGQQQNRPRQATRSVFIDRLRAIRPFQSPVPFIFVRGGVRSDWKFFLNDEEWLSLWARRFGESAAMALAGELRATNW